MEKEYTYKCIDCGEEDKAFTTPGFHAELMESYKAAGGYRCNECEYKPPDPPFTQEQLLAACRQMRGERREDFRTAERAKTWFANQLQMEEKNFPLRSPYSSGWGLNHDASPHKAEYNICCIHQTYGPYLNDFTDKLDKADWATKKSDKFYEIETPEGTYTVIFEYFDNHCTGY